MRLETFFNNFDLLADAPNGVQKLRELILQLAVQGKLVPQDPNDEPACILLEKIKAEKERLIKEKRIRKDELPPLMTANGALYNLPEGWEWCRWNDVALHIGDVDHKMPLEVEEGIPYVSPRDFTSNNGIIFAGAKKISRNDFERLRKKIQPELGDIIFPRYGTIGENRYVETSIDFLASYSCAVIKNFKYFTEPKYSFYYSLSQLVKAEIERYINKTTQANVGVKSIKNFVFPLPPLQEQKRIVAKVDQLMALCDELETRQRHRHEDCVHLNNAAIAQLLTTREPNDFSKYWQSICDNFDLLYSVPENIGKLRQAILQLAVQGKLVPQDPNDEPASVLIEKIKSEKEWLVKENKIRKSEPLPSIEDVPFELPPTWVWSNVSNITSLVTDGEHATPTRISVSEVPLATAKNVRDGYLDLENTDFVSYQTAEKCWKRCEPMHNDILMVCVGATTGRLCLIKHPPKFVLVRSVALIRPFESHIYPAYIAVVIKSPLGQSQIWNKVKQSAQPCLYINKIQSLCIPIPPLAEQKRIVAKVDQLVSLCDELEAKLMQSQINSEKLMDAALRQVLGV